MPTLAPIADVELMGGSPMHIALDGIDPDGGELSFRAVSSDPLVTTFIPEGNRSMRISVRSADGAIDGDMVLELFETRAPRVTEQIIRLAEDGFYDGIIFHRVIDDFMIQGGDPTGTGTGGSYLGDFNDQFHFDLQHSGSGVLSMAKSGDDTNDSQFFITDAATPHLDYNHSVFGQLVEGQDILDLISSADGDDDDTIPDVEIVMESVEIFQDNENAVLMLSAPEDYTGTVGIVIIITDELGNEYVQTPFNVNVTAEPTGSAYYDKDPFLADIPEIRTTVDTPVVFQLTANDADGGAGAVFLDEEILYGNNLAIPFLSHGDLGYVSDFNTGETTVTPTNGLVGMHPIVVSTAAYADAIDYQIVPIYIAPAVAPNSTLDMTLVRDLTEVDSFGEVDALPEDQWIDEWDSFAIEIWATIDDPNQFGVHTATTDLVYDAELFTATEIEYGPGFDDNQTGQIDTAAGRVNDIGGSTDMFVVDPTYPVDDNNLALYGDNAPVLVARVYFEPNLNGSGVPLDVDGQYASPVTDLGFAFENAEVKWNSVDTTTVTTAGLQDAELWPMMYDIDDSGTVGLGDLSRFALGYGHAVGDGTWTWASDFDHNGTVGLGDLSYFAANYGRTGATAGDVVYASTFPADWQPPAEAAAPASSQYDLALGEAIAASQATDDPSGIETVAVDLVMQMYLE